MTQSDARLPLGRQAMRRPRTAAGYQATINRRIARGGRIGTRVCKDGRLRSVAVLRKVLREELQQ